MLDWVKLDGYAEYNVTLKLMEEKVQAVISGTSNEVVYLLEHESCYTAGTGYDQNELLSSNSMPVIYTGRGGKFTYHGPGQRVIYPVLDLNSRNIKDIKLYVRNLEHWMIHTLTEFDIKAFTIPGMVGIWVRHGNVSAKIGAIGVRLKKWVTYHGIAININTNLNNYSGIIPCGIDNFPVTSMRALGCNISIADFDVELKKQFNNFF